MSSLAGQKADRPHQTADSAERRQVGASEEPTIEELAAIEREWPLIDAEMAKLDAEIRILNANGGTSPLDWRRLRRAQRQVLYARTRLARELATTPAGLVVA